MEAAPTEIGEVRGDLRQQRVGGAHQGLAGEAREPERRDRAHRLREPWGETRGEREGAGEGDGVDSIGGGGLSTAQPDSKHNANSA